MHDADARHLYVDVAEPLTDRAVLTMRRPGSLTADPPTADAKPSTSAEFRAQAATSAARSIGEAESQLEKDLRSGYRVVVTFESRGEAERTRYNLNRVESHFLEGHARPSDGRGCGWSRRRSPTASSRPSCASSSSRSAASSTAAVQRRRRPAGAGRWRRSPTCASATTSSTRTTGSPASPASRRRRSPGSPATTSSSSTAATTRSSRPTEQLDEDHPLRRLRRRGAAALGARVEALGRGQGARPAGGPRARGRAAQPLRRAPGAQGPRLRARRRVAARARALVPLPRDRRPDRRDRGGQGRHGVRPARWTA